MPASKDLAEILRQRNPEKYKAIIERAELNGYHDFKFERVPGHPEYGEDICPKVRLVADLAEHPELKDIREQVINGDYDDQADEEDQELMRMDLLEDKSPDEMFELLGLRKPTKEERNKFNHRVK